MASASLRKAPKSTMPLCNFYVVNNESNMIPLVTKNQIVKGGLSKDLQGQGFPLELKAPKAVPQSSADRSQLVKELTKN